jgi:hypothetical protein
MTVRRPARERVGKFTQIDLVQSFKRSFANPVLFSMMVSAQAQGPPIGRLQPLSSVSPAPDMSTFDRERLALRH